MVRCQSEKHEKIIKIIAKLIGTKAKFNLPLYRGGSYPDIETPERDIEVEMLYNNLRKKCKGYFKDRKRTLIIAVPDEFLEYFDEIILWDDPCAEVLGKT